MNVIAYTFILLNADCTISDVLHRIYVNHDGLGVNEAYNVLRNAFKPKGEPGQPYQVYASSYGCESGTYLHSSGILRNVYKVKYQRGWLGDEGQLFLDVAVSTSGPTSEILDDHRNVIRIKNVNAADIELLGMDSYGIVNVPHRDRAEHIRCQVSVNTMTIMAMPIVRCHNSDKWRISLDGKTAYLEANVVLELKHWQSVEHP